MIDDSVPVNELKVGITGAKVKLLDVFADLEAKMDEEEQCLLMGINTTHAIQSTKSVTLADNRYHCNKRTPTSMVYVFCGKFSDGDGEYCPNFYLADLPCREDVICAAQIIKAGFEVIIDRIYHFIDKPITVGGVKEYFIT